ncbi:MAG: amidohydrolase family protein, partial [Planctomycetes bacterium]|nr:amidohydrolase family protein [Planctomycetota bacterium]
MDGFDKPHEIKRQSYRARWIFPGDSPPLENATVEIEFGRITAVHARVDSQAVDLGNSVLIPGLVNAHTHLEFSHLTAPIQPAQPFTDWIRAIVQTRRERTEPAETAIAHGLAESLRHGVTAVGEIATEDIADSYGGRKCAQMVVFRELIGFRPEQIEPQLAIARQFLDVTGNDDSTVVRALSPHSPYSVHPELFTPLVA